MVETGLVLGRAFMGASYTKASVLRPGCLALVGIRDRAPGDTPFLQGLGHAAFAEYGPDAGRETLSMALRGTTFIAERSGAAVGLVVLEENADRSLHVAAIAVVEEHRGVGVGRALIQAAERHARSRGAPRIRLVTADSNLPALQLFLRCGFRRSNRAPGRYRRGQRNLVFEKAL